MANDPPRWESDDCDDPIHERHWADVVTLSWAFCAEDDDFWPCAAILAHEAAVGYMPAPGRALHRSMATPTHRTRPGTRWYLSTSGNRRPC